MERQMKFQMCLKKVNDQAYGDTMSADSLNSKKLRFWWVKAMKNSVCAEVPHVTVCDCTS